MDQSFTCKHLYLPVVVVGLRVVGGAGGRDEGDVGRTFGVGLGTGHCVPSGTASTENKIYIWGVRINELSSVCQEWYGVTDSARSKITGD